MYEKFEEHILLLNFSGGGIRVKHCELTPKTDINNVQYSLYGILDLYVAILRQR